MSLRKQWEEEAFQQGFEQGFELGFPMGLRKGDAAVVSAERRRQLGDIEARREQVAGASPEELERWTQRILSASLLDDVLD